MRIITGNNPVCTVKTHVYTARTDEDRSVEALQYVMNRYGVPGEAEVRTYPLLEWGWTEYVWTWYEVEL